MKELQRRQRIKQILYSWPSLIVVAIVSGLMLKGAITLLIIERQNAHRVSELEAESEKLLEKGEKLGLEIERLGTEEGIVEEIKEKFSVTRTGEHMAVIVDDQKKATSTENELSWYKRWWGVIIGE